MKKKIIENILKSTSLLNYHMALTIHHILLQIAGEDENMTLKILQQTNYLMVGRRLFMNKKISFVHKIPEEVGAGTPGPPPSTPTLLSLSGLILSLP